MPINVHDNALISQQAEQAVGAALKDTIKDVNKRADERKTDEAKEQSLTQQLLEAKNPAKKGNVVLANLVAKLGGNLKLGERSESKQALKDENDMLFETNKESVGDQVSIKSSLEAIKKTKKFGDQGQSGGEEPGANDSKGFKADAKNYSNAYVQMLVNGGGEVKKKIKNMENKMIQEGIIDHQSLLGLQQNIKNALRAQVANQIKESIIKKMLSPEKSVDKAINGVSLDQVVSSAFHNKELGGWDFGGYNDSLQGTVDEKLSEATSEIRDYTTEEIRKVLTSSNLEKKATTDKELHNLLELASKVGFNAQEFLGDWEIRAIDIGLVPVPFQGDLKSNTNTDSQNERRQSEFMFTQNDEKDLLISQLRACYMRTALSGDFKTMVETSFKMRKLKNGLIKLGVNMIDFERIEKEGKEVAVDKLWQMLEEALYERATLYDLAGPAYKLINQKIKGVKKNLDRLGVVISDAQFKNMIDSANYKMFDTARHEYEETKIVYEGQPNPIVEKKLIMLKKLLTRIMQESGINAGIDFNFKKKRAA